MSGKVEKNLPTESSANSNSQPIRSNPYNETNINEQQQQQQVINERNPDEPPPPYPAIIQPSSAIKAEPQHGGQNPTFNNPLPPVTIVQNRIIGRHPTDAFCPNCQTMVHTRAETSSTIITILIAIVIFFFCCCLAFIPFCMSSCKKTTHYCPNCSRVLGEIHEFD